jgi:hypothetical protein
MVLVKWEGYSPQENRWETFENVMENAEGLLKEYFAENANMEKDKRFENQKERQKDAASAQRKLRKHRKV